MSDGGGHQGAEGRDGSISEPQILGHQGRNVTVVVRVRPLSADEARAERHCDEGAIDVRGPNDLVLNVEGSRRRHSFDHVLGPSCSQEAVFRRVGQPAVDNCLSGYNSTILAYGQTGSGKTHTILGDFIDIGPFLPLASSKPDTVVAAAKPNIHLRTSESKYATKPAQQWAELPPEAGLTPRVFSYLFEQVAEKTADPDGGTTFAVRVSFIEIYNEVVTDLLSGASGLPVRQSLSTRSTYVEGVAEEQVFGISDAMALVSRGNERRKVAHTNMNAASSRSHSILSCTIEGRAEEHGGVARVRRAVLNLVDLAGSERQTRTGATGARLKEASSINKSLSTLGHVILSLVSGSPHVPYRDSKLTHILQDSLGGNAKAVMIAAVSPSTPSLPETEGTLGFASRARRMKNTAVVNEDAAGDARALRRENERLRKELEAFRALEASRVAGPYCSAALLAENERLRAEAHALRCHADATRASCREKSKVEESLKDAELQYEKWSSLELKVEQGEDPNPEQCHSPNLVDLMSANESLAQHLEEVLHDKTQLEREVKKLAAKLRTLRNTQDHLGQENTSLRVTAELAQEFNVAFHRATREADIAIERISELEHERDTFAKELRIEQQAHRRERQEHEVLLQEFSDLTKLLEEVIKQRDQALADRDLAVQQKLESSIQCAYAEEQLQAAWENSDSFERRRASADEAIIAQLKPSALRLCSSSRTHCEPISPENMSPLVTTEVQASNR